MNIGKEREDFRNWLYLGQTFGMVGNTIPRIMQKIKGKHMSATHEVGDSEFEKWWTQFKSDEFRLAESGWTEKEIAKLAWRAAIKADEQAVLKSPEMQALRSDSERMKAALKRIRSDSERMKAALKRIANTDSMSYHTLDSAKITAKAASPQPDHIPDAGKMVVSDRSMKEIKAALAGANGKEHTLIFSAKEVRSLLNTIVNQNQRIERFEKKIADHIEQDRKMPTDTQMLDWLIRKNTRVEHYPFRSIDEEVLVIDPYGNVLTSASNPREAIAKAMRGEK